MKLFTLQEKIMGIKLISEMLQVLEEYESIEELKKYLEKKLRALALMI